jgi:hypothetical protein
LYDQRLVRKINQGRAFVLVGSGPSSEVGYPSWASLAELTIAELQRRKCLSDKASYEKYLAQKKYPELFSQAERDLGDRNKLIELLREFLKPAKPKRGFVYELLANWPFACYLTTNWDDEIDQHLRAKKIFFSTIRNSKDDLSRVRHDASHLIVKLHSDLTQPDRAVVTSGDYARLTGQESQFFRDKLKAIFEMFDVLIVGHSLSDPDLQLVLRIAKETASPEHPVFLVATELTSAEVREYLERFNIVAISYENPDGTHLQLRRMLALLDHFVVPRSKRIDVKLLPSSPEELEAAQAVATYRRLATAKDSELSPVLYIGPLILRALQGEDKGLAIEQLAAKSPLSLAMKTEGVQVLIPSVLQALKQDGLLEQKGLLYSLTSAGANRASEMSDQHVSEEEQAYGQFSLELQSRCSTKVTNLKDLVQTLQDTLVRVFRQRGLSIANAVITGQSLSHNALSDVFSALSSSASGIASPEIAIAFMEAAQEFLLKPNNPQRQYLASLSQGYFLYHLLGLDPSCAKIRRDVFEHTIWWCDSSTLIPLLAKGTANYEYAADLFRRLQNLKAFTLTTGRLVREILEHLTWAIRLLEKEPSQSPVVLEAATQKGGYKQNLFLDGFIRLSAEGKVGRFSEYLAEVAPFGPTDIGIRRSLANLGVRTIDADQLEGFKADDTREIFELVFEISEVRQKSLTFRSNLQVEAEAEILQIIRRLKEGSYKAPVPAMELEHTYFLSQSRILDRIPPAEPISWTPEILYRYIISLPGEKLDPDLLQRCMLQEYFGKGIVIVDNARYEKFFGPSIDLANSTYREERDKYLKEVAAISVSELDKAFDSTPDLEKPFFVQQMGWRVAARETRQAAEERLRADSERKRALEAQQELALLKREKDTHWKRRKQVEERQLAAEERNARDPKHQKKRQRQAKKRRRQRK